LVFTKTDVIKETCNKCVVRTKAAFAKFIASLKKDK
jgi:hypothetical protein